MSFLIAIMFFYGEGKLRRTGEPIFLGTFEIVERFSFGWSTPLDRNH
jgi:hypothetical protein